MLRQIIGVLMLVPSVMMALFIASLVMAKDSLDPVGIVACVLMVWGCYELARRGFSRLGLLVLLLAVTFASGAPVLAQDSPWIDIGGRKVALTLAVDHNCVWDDTIPAMLNLPGMCGRPDETDTKNVFMIAVHNPWCSPDECYSDLDFGGEFAIGALYPGYSDIFLYAGGRSYHGTVIEVASGARVDGSADFLCPTERCGVLISGFGKRPAFVVVRIAYQLGLRSDYSV